MPLEAGGRYVAMSWAQSMIMPVLAPKTISYQIKTSKIVLQRPLQHLQDASQPTACERSITSFFLYRIPSLRQDTALVTAMGGRACTCVWQHQTSSVPNSSQATHRRQQTRSLGLAATP